MMKEERLIVLKLLEDKKITVEEANTLLEAMTWHRGTNCPFKKINCKSKC